MLRGGESSTKKSGTLSSRSGRLVGGAVAVHPSIYQKTACRRITGKGSTGGREETTPMNDIRQLLARKLKVKGGKGERSSGAREREARWEWERGEMTEPYPE